MGKESTYNAGDMSSIPGWGRALEDGMAIHFSILLENPMDKCAWWATVHSVAESGVTEATEQTHTAQQAYAINRK